MKKSGSNFSFTDFGSFANTDQHVFEHPKLPKKFPGKKFLKEELELTSMEVSINKFWLSDFCRGMNNFESEKIYYC